MSRYKLKNGGTPEVHTARSKLNGVLQNLRERTDDSPQEDSFIKEEPSDSDEFGSPSKSQTGSIRPHSHRQQQQPLPRKRKRPREDTPPLEPGLQFHHTYVLKLFDRSVDLAQFEASTSLYPVCRAWIKNQPHNRELGIRERTPTPEPEVFGLPEDEDDVRDVFHLPKPLYNCCEVGLKRVPSPVPQPDEQLDINADPANAPAPEQLLLDHFDRWKQTREKWKVHSRKVETLYDPSMRVLKDMFDKANTS